MASGTSGAMSTSNTYIQYTISITENSTSIENNTSNVTVSVMFYRTNTGYSTYGTGTVYCTINGTTYSASVTSSQKITSSGIVLFSKTLDISHDSDGSKTLATAAYISHSQVTSSNQSYSLALSTIPRASDISVGNGTLGVAMTITANRKSSSFKHKLTWICGAYSGTIVDLSSSASSNTSWSFTPEMKLSTGAPNGTSLYASFTLETYNGSAYVGSSTKYVWFTIPSSVVPSCSITLSDANGYLATYGGYIQGKSILKVVASGSGIYGSTISSYSTVVNGKTYSGSTVNASLADKSGTVNVRTTVKDSRSRSASASKSITVIPYNAPVISKLTVARCNSDGTENDRGSYTKVTISYTITSLSNKNTKAASLKYKKTSASTWSTQALTAEYSIANQNIVIATDDAYSYDIQLVVSDAFGSTSKSTSVSTGYCLYHIPSSGKGVTFGGVAEADGFNVKMDSTFEGSIDARERIYMGGNKKTSDEKQIYFQSKDDATYPHNVQIFGGNGESKNAFGVYDGKNSRSVMSYDDTENTLTITPKVHFPNGLSEDIRIAPSGDCNTLLTSGNYYIGNSGKNKPGSGENGWLTVKAYGTDASYCYQEYITYSGDRYFRMRDNGSWKAWIRDGGSSGPKQLWKGIATMFASQTAYLSETVSSQAHGIVLVFGEFTNSSTDPAAELVSCFVPKTLVAEKSSRGHSFNVSNAWYIGSKYLYIFDDKIVGHDRNSQTVTVGGATFNNEHFVMMRVYGV